jgi:hypothetical protein
MNQQPIVEKSDTIIELLAAQCSDLEKLLSIAREETRAAEAQDFERILEIVSERSQIGERLEVFQRRISELRGFLGDSAEINRHQIASRIIEVASLTLEQDEKTRKLLNGVKEETALELRNLETGNRNANVYLRGRQTGLAYNGSF